jgi:hypothetical protein
VQLKNKKLQYILSVILMSEYEMVYFSCDINLFVNKKKRALITEAIVEVNERMWIGHFDLISTGNRIVYSLTIPFVSSFMAMANESMIESIIQLITEECNRFYNYFAMIIENDKPLNLPINTLLLESAGEA